MDFSLLAEKQQYYLENQHRISEIALEKLQTAFAITFTHNSTAIEGNTLSLLETKLLLEDKISVGGKSLHEIYEVVNHHKATQFVIQQVAEGLPLDEKITKDIHAILQENIFVGGIYRNEPVRITGASHKPPVGEKMYGQIKNFFADLPYQTDRNPISLAAWTHAEFVRIHPFPDGNGRTSRQIMNYQLLFSQFPAVSIAVADRLDYYTCLDCYASQGDLHPFIDLLSTLVEERLNDLLELIPTT